MIKSRACLWCFVPGLVSVTATLPGTRPKASFPESGGPRLTTNDFSQKTLLFLELRYPPADQAGRIRAARGFSPCTGVSHYATTHGRRSMKKPDSWVPWVPYVLLNLKSPG